MLYRYYQTAHRASTWKSCLEEEVDKVVDALHMTVFAVDVLETQGDSRDFSDAKYWGNFVMDIDQESIELAIESAHKIMAFLLPIVNNPHFIKLYASGGKGFHIELPWKLFFNKKKTSKDLPAIYKGVAKAIETASGALGIDYMLYSKKKGHMLRVANKLREAKAGEPAAYKVPISYAELLNMTAETYKELCSAPRQEFKMSSELLTCTGLVRLLNQAERELKHVPIYKTSETEAFLAGFGETHPACVTKITQWEDVKDASNFNAMAMQLAIYLNAVDAPESVKEEVVREFSAAGHSSTYKTEEDRVQHITTGVLNYVADMKFSCAAMKNLVAVGAACHSCKVHQSIQRDVTMATGIVQTVEGYFSAEEGVAGKQLTNFYLDIDEIYYSKDHTGKVDVDWMLAKVSIHDNKGEIISYKEVVIDTFLDTKAFKRVFLQNRNSSIITANAHEIEAIMNHLLISNKGKPGMRYVSPAGLQRLSYIPEGQTEKHTPMVWVEKDWSIASDGLVKAFKLKIEQPNMVQQESRPRITSLSPKQDDTILRLLRCSDEYIVGVLLGWVISAQVKEHIIHRIKEFPLLHLYGVAGSGKTMMSSLFTSLGSADYQQAPISVSSTTHAALREMAYSSTSIPRIFDECGKEKIKPTYWPTVKEVLKACYQQSAMNIGGISNKQKAETHSVVTYTERATAPVIYLSTVAVDEAELRERSIELRLSKEPLQNPTWRANFAALQTNPERFEYLFDVAKLVMMHSLYSKPDHIYKMYQEALLEIPESFDTRAKKSYAYVYLGLRFFRDVMEYANATPALLGALEAVTNRVKGITVDTEKEFIKQNSRTEFDDYFEKLNQALSSLDINNNPALRANVHYLRVDFTLYLSMESAHMEYLKICRLTGVRPEFNSHKQLLSSIEGYGIYLGTEKLPTLSGGMATWHKFDTRRLEERGCDCGRYQELQS